MTRARIYARFSTENQDPLSIADQLRVCRDYAARLGWTIESEHSDEAISGAALGNRPGARAVLDRLQAGEVLLLNDLERLARSQDLAPLISRLRFRRVRVIAVQSAFDSTSPTAGMQAGLSGIMSEQYRAQVAQRTHSALELRAKTGRRTGGKAYADAEIVREIFQRWTSGQALRSIANELNRRGVPSPGAEWERTKRRKDGRWLASTLHELLHNERYIGRVIWNRSQWIRDPDTGKRQRRERPRSEWIVRECEPLIDEATWQRAQARFRTRQGRGGVSRYLLSGLLVCAECGAKMTVVGGSQHRYRCGTFSAGGPAACSNALSVPRKVAEDLILGPVLDDMLSPESTEEGIREWRRALREPEVEEPSEEDTLHRLVREGVLSREIAQPAIEEARRKALERRRAQPARISERPTAAGWRAAVERLREVLVGDDVVAAREVLRGLIGELPYRPAGNELIAVPVRHQTQAVANGRWVHSLPPLPTYLPPNLPARRPRKG